ncbi:MAG: GNAT family N-acetyltransferase [Blastocatellia bacterium]
MQVNIRDATIKDINSIIVITEIYYKEDNYSFSSEKSAKTLDLLINNPTWGKVWIIEEKEEILGYFIVTLGFSLEYGGRDAFLDEIYFLPAARGKGLGKTCVELAIEWCKTQDVKAIHLEVEQKRVAAIKLYEKIGFTLHDRLLMTRYI